SQIVSKFRYFRAFVDSLPAPFMMLCNIPVRRTAPRGWPAHDPTRETPSEALREGGGRRSNRPGNSQAKGPRSGDELLESEACETASTEGVIRCRTLRRGGDGEIS